MTPSISTSLTDTRSTANTKMAKVVIKRNGIMRLLYTCKHTFTGLKWMCHNEAAFQQELMLFLPLSIFACLADVSVAKSAMLIVALLFVLFAELANTAIEVVVDRIGLEFDTLSGLAKDIASAFVFLSMMMAAIVWWVILWA